MQVQVQVLFGLGFDWLGLSFALHAHVYVAYGTWVQCTWLQAHEPYARRLEAGQALEPYT